MQTSSFRKALFLSILLIASKMSGATAPEFALESRHFEGTVWFGFEVEAKAAEHGAHGGWDLFDGKSKQLWVGSGWDRGQRGQWGLWGPKGNASEFSAPVVLGEATVLIGKIDFGKPEPGDESVHLWQHAPTSENLVARLEGVTITGVDGGKAFLARGADYQLAQPKFSREVTALNFTPPVGGGSTLFAEKIRPLFAEKCLSCHGDKPEKIKGGFDMRTRAAILANGESGETAVLPGEPNKSILMDAILWKYDDLEMPPKENDRLTEAEIAMVEKWIAAGAPWADKSRTVTETDPAWAEPDETGAVRVSTSGGQSEGWTNRRYAADDLWAYRPRAEVIPPGQGHPVEQFILRRLAERGLAPSQPATRRELIRRSTFGLTGLPPTPGQVEEFVKSDSPKAFEQLLERLLDSQHYGERIAQHWLDVTRYADSNGFARDEFRPSAHTYRSYVIRSFNEDKPYDRFVKEQIAGDQLGIAEQDALAFLWMGPWEQTAMSVAAVTRQQWLDDVTNSIGVTFLGQQLRCAKCHDHKFDPVPTRDYYSFQAVFADTKHSAGKGNFKITAQRAQAIHILHGGSLESPGERVAAGALSLLGDIASLEFRTELGKDRAALGEWIASPQNPLTARVIVNRVWQMHFGRGLVATPNDFGRMGAHPTHPELLDWLAGWFVQNGWSVKKLHRLIMTSATYQRSSVPLPAVATKDPNNQLLSYFPPRRLSAEEIRDSMLAISGELNPQVGGPSFYPEINWEVAFQPRRLMGDIAPPYEPSPKLAERNRRSLYAVRLRNLGHPFMEVLNRPASELSCDRRDETTVTPQVFTLWHGELANERALALASRIADAHSKTEAQVVEVFRAIYGRLPIDPEKRNAVNHLLEMIPLHREHTLVPQPVPTSITVENVVEKTGELQKRTFQLKKLAQYEDDRRPWEVEPEVRALADLCLVLFNSSEFLYVY